MAAEKSVRFKYPMNCSSCNCARAFMSPIVVDSIEWKVVTPLNIEIAQV